MNIFGSGGREDNRSLVNVDKDFTELVYKYQDELYRYACYLIYDKAEAFDIVQDTFVALHKNFKTLDHNLSLRPWLYKVAKNLCLDYLKKRKALNFSQMDEDEIANIPSEDLSLDELADSGLLEARLKEIFSELPLPAREIAFLKYFEDFTFKQIAEHLDIGENTVKSHFYRAKSKIYHLLKQNLYGRTR